MRKLVLNLVMATLTVLVAFTSCKKNDDDSKVQLHLLETITYSSGNSIRYTYDNQSRITKMYMYMGKDLLITITVTYSEQDVITLTYNDIANPENNFTGKHIKNGNTVTFYKNEELAHTISLNNEEYPIRIEGMVEEQNGEWVPYVYTYQYQDGNMIQMNYVASVNDIESGNSTEYKYDNKKSPFYNCKSPAWLLGNPLGSSYGRQNNVIEQISSFFNIKTEYDYEYNAAEYPTKCTMTSKIEGFEGNESKIIVEFTYR